jgi:hypothetical protein
VATPEDQVITAASVAIAADALGLGYFAYGPFVSLICHVCDKD